MWRRVVSSHLKTLVPSWRSALVGKSTSHAYALSANRSILSHSAAFLNRNFSSDSGSSVKKKVEDVMPIATGHEREELEAELEGKDILDIDFPVGPFGTKILVRTVRNLNEQNKLESPAVVKSYYDKRIVGCPGDEGEDEHDVVWFWLEKGKPHECPVCSQYFVLEVVGPGGPPDGHGDEDHEHH